MGKTEHGRGDGTGYNARHLHKPGSRQHPELGFFKDPWPQPQPLYGKSNALMIPWDCELHQHGAVWPAAVLSPRDLAFSVAENAKL
jgi:hypothetical protein